MIGCLGGILALTNFLGFIRITLDCPFYQTNHSLDRPISLRIAVRRSLGSGLRLSFLLIANRDAQHLQQVGDDSDER